MWGCTPLLATALFYKNDHLHKQQTPYKNVRKIATSFADPSYNQFSDLLYRGRRGNCYSLWHEKGCAEEQKLAQG